MRCATLRWGSWVISGISSGQGHILCGTRLSAGNVFRNASTIANRISYSRLTLRQYLSEGRYGDRQHHRNYRGHGHRPLQNDALHNAPSLSRSRHRSALLRLCKHHTSREGTGHPRMDYFCLGHDILGVQKSLRIELGADYLYSRASEKRSSRKLTCRRLHPFIRSNRAGAYGSRSSPPYIFG
jgi:hypothetical protein